MDKKRKKGGCKMKRIMALLLCVSLLFAMPAVSFAANSPFNDSFGFLLFETALDTIKVTKSTVLARKGRMTNGLQQPWKARAKPPRGAELDAGTTGQRDWREYIVHWPY